MGTFIIKDKEYKKEWLRLNEILNDFPEIQFIFAVGTNSLGKTYSVEDEIVKRLLDGKTSGVIRNLKTEAQKLVFSWEQTLKRYNLNEDYAVDANGVFKIIDKTKKRDNRELMIPFVYASSFDSSCPPLEGINFWLWDEFLSGNEKRAFTMKDPIKFIRTLTNRTRAWKNEEPFRMVLCANPHTMESDLFSAFGLDYDWDKLHSLQDDIKIHKEGKVLSLVFPSEEGWDNSCIQRQRNMFQGVFQGDTYKYKMECEKQIYPNYDTTNLNLKCCWGQENASLEVEYYLIYAHPVQDLTYIKPVEYCEIPKDCPIYTTEWHSHRAIDTFLQDPTNIWDIFGEVWYAHHEGKCLYFAPYTREACKELIQVVDLAYYEVNER